MRFFDTHCHLADPKLAPEALEIAGRAFESGLEGFCIICADPENLENVPSLAQKLKLQYPDKKILWSTGLHPHEAQHFSEDIAQKIRKQIVDAYAVGETGLDYHYNFSSPDQQKKVFDWHIDLSCEFQKPLVIHCREASADILKALQREDIRKHSRPGILHCFTENWDFAKELLELNFMISFSGILGFNNAENIREVARKLPLDRILIETDSPYLAPKPHRGKRNEPAYVRHVFDTLAQLRSESPELLSEALIKNTERTFL